MATSQNGWPIVGKSACDQGPFQGASFPNGILKGDVATIARWQLKRYAQLVEPVVPGTCWGWFVKVIEGSAVKSNHGSATAWDINATQHPMGTAASHNMSAHEIAMCHQIETESGNVLRWGGDFSRPDPMHWEIIGSRAQVAAFATRIRNGQAAGAVAPVEEDDPLAAFSEGDLEGASFKYPTGQSAPGASWLHDIWAMFGYVKSTNALVKLIADKDPIDEAALAAAMAPAVAGIVVPALLGAVRDAGGTPLTEDQLKAIVVSGVGQVLTAGTGGTP
jgi:hypothetical protein